MNATSDKKPAAERRTRIVPVRMSDPEYAAASSCAASLGISLSRLLRSQAAALPASRTDLALAAEITRIGINVNQIARAVNSGLAPALIAVVPTLDELHAALTELRGQLRKHS